MALSNSVGRVIVRRAGQKSLVSTTEQSLGLTEVDQSPAAVGLSMMLLSSLTARESADVLKRVSGAAHGPISTSWANTISPRIG